jgi:hypothetical protein
MKRFASFLAAWGKRENGFKEREANKKYDRGRKFFRNPLSTFLLRNFLFFACLFQKKSLLARLYEKGRKQGRHRNCLFQVPPLVTKSLGEWCRAGLVPQPPDVRVGHPPSTTPQFLSPGESRGFLLS